MLRRTIKNNIPSGLDWWLKFLESSMHYASIPCAQGSNLDFDFSDDFSFVVRMKQFASFSTSGSDRWINRIWVWNYGGYDIGFFPYLNLMYVYIVLWDNNNTVISFVRFIEPLSNIINQEVCYTFIKKSQNAANFQIYKNNTPRSLEVMINAIPTTSMKSNKPIILNHQNGTPDFNQNDLYSIQAYNKALSDDEIKFLYQTKWKTIPNSIYNNLQGNRRFDDKQNMFLSDRSWNNNHWSLVNYSLSEVTLWPNNKRLDQFWNPVLS